MDVSWVSFDFLTGERGPQVVTKSRGSVSVVIGESTTTSLEVLCWDEESQASVPGWQAATDPGRSMLVALDDDERILWGGIVVTRIDQGDVWVTVPLASPEAYLDRRYTPNLTLNNTSQVAIMRELIEAADGTSFETGTSAYARDRVYLDDDDKTVLSNLSELAEVLNGPEFTCRVEWTDDTHTAIRRKWVIRDSLGGLSAATFEMPGSIVGYSFTEDFSADNGANDVLATSSGEGKTRPESDHKTDIRPGWARFEHRFSPSTSIKNKSTLNNHATKRLDEMRDGRNELTFEVRLDVAPLPGVDFHLGDVVRVTITSPRFPARVDVNGATVAGFDRDMRVVGYTLDFDGNRMVPVTREV